VGKIASRFSGFVIGLLLTTLALSACRTVVETVEVKKVETQIVEVEKEKVVVQTEIVKETVVVPPKPFSTPHPILRDLRVRRALAYCTDKMALAASVYPFLPLDQLNWLVIDSFLPPYHWAYAGDENITFYPYDPGKGMALLEEAGWKKVQGMDYRVNADGNTLALKLTTTTFPLRQAWAAAWEEQMRACGVQIIRQHVPSSWWLGETTGLARRDFELGAFAWPTQPDPGVQRSWWSCDQIPDPDNHWQGYNYIGWCNSKVTKAFQEADRTISRSERITDFTVAQQEFTNEVPSIPLFYNAEFFAALGALEGILPTPGEKYYNYNIQDWGIPGRDTLIIGFPREPATLFSLMDGSFATQFALEMVRPRPYTTLEYDFQPLYLAQLSTLEEGQASDDEIEVKAGDQVLDAQGNVVELKEGYRVIDANGQEVQFNGEPIKMKQLVVNYVFRNDLKWSDGEPLQQADFQLGYKIACDPDSGTTSFQACQRTARIEFDGTSYRITWVPGYQDSQYFLPPYDPYPAHQKLSDGRMLVDVPAGQWAALPEVTEYPLSYGPYRVSQWEKGNKIVFERNPFWPGKVRTPTIVLKFVNADNAESRLMEGEVDVLGPETLVIPSEKMLQAQRDGLLKIIMVPGPNWEHIDFNQFVK